MAGKPSFQFYPGDWLRDPAVRSVSFAARGLWTDMLCLMHQSDRRGYLQLNGKPVTTEQLARMTGSSPDEVSRLLQELSNSGVFSCTEHGMIYSRRMARESRISDARSEAGKKGAPFGALGGRPRKTAKTANRTAKEGQVEGQNNPPSSSPSGEEEGLPSSSAAPPEKKARAPNPLWDAVVEITGADSKVAASFIGKLVRELKSAEPPYSAEEVRSLPAAIAAKGMSFTLTLGSIPKWIGLVRQKRAVAGNGIADAVAECAARRREKNEVVKGALEGLKQ